MGHGALFFLPCNRLKTMPHAPFFLLYIIVSKIEIERLQQKVGEKGLTIIPLNIILNDKGLIKIVVGLAKGKNVRDKSMAIKEKDLDRDMKKILKKTFEE